MMPDGDNSTVKVPSLARNYLKTLIDKRGDEEAPKPQDSTIRFCRYCGKGLKSSKALVGHLRIHSQNHGKYSKPGLIHHMIKTPKLETEQYSPNREEDDGFTVKQGIESIVSHHTIDFLKDINVWSQTGKRGWMKTASDDDIIHDALTLRLYCGPADSQIETNKKKKTEGAADSKSRVLELSGNCVTTQHKSKCRRSMRKAKVVRLHQCEICDKIFESGQALGGHKTKHRVKDLSHQINHHPYKRMLDFDLNITLMF